MKSNGKINRYITLNQNYLQDADKLYKAKEPNLSSVCRQDSI